MYLHHRQDHSCKLTRPMSAAYLRRCAHRHIVAVVVREAAAPGGVERAVSVLLVQSLVVATITCSKGLSMVSNATQPCTGSEGNLRSRDKDC